MKRARASNGASEASGNESGADGRGNGSLPTVSTGVSGGVGEKGGKEDDEGSPSDVDHVEHVDVAKAEAAPPALPLWELWELGSESTFDTLFNLVESDLSVSVLAWELLKKLPTNRSLYNGFA